MLCVVGITMIDFSPRDSWNFVFGQASLTDGLGYSTLPGMAVCFCFCFYSSYYKGKVKKLLKTSSSDYSIFDNSCIPEVICFFAVSIL